MFSRKQITYESDGRSLLADVLVPKGAQPVPFVLFLPNWGAAANDNMEYSRSLARRGFGAVLMGTEEVQAGPEMSVQAQRGQHLRDAHAAYDAMFELPEADATEIFAVGQSYGGYVAALLADTRPLAGVVLRAPAAPGWHDRALVSLRKSQVPVLVVSSEKDEQIPVKTTMSYLAAATGPRAHHLIAGAGHDLNSRQSGQFDRIMREWLEARVALAYS